MSWFDVDKEGFAKLMENRDRAFVIHELVQNAWDTNAKQVEVHLEKIPGTPKAKLTVHDNDPEGFKNFSDAWTLYAESTKKDNPNQRGIFGEGEIAVLAMCYSAIIKTTTGTVIFDGKGRRTSREKTKQGSYFEGVVRMNQAQYEECCAAVLRLIPPAGVTTYFNGQKLNTRKPVAKFEVALATTIGDEMGNIRPTTRRTDVYIHEPQGDEVAAIYEMGIPVVETGDKWHVDVQQRVPLNRDRDNVTPAYLRTLRTMVVNAMHDDIDEEEAQGTWVVEAIKDERIDQDAYENVQELRHGKDAVIHDPSHPEATKRAQAAGLPVIYGRSMSSDERTNGKRFGTFRTAHEVTPEPTPYSESGDPVNLVKDDKITDGMRRVEQFAKDIGKHVIDQNVFVQFAVDVQWPFAATYGDGELTFNVGRLGYKWFDYGISKNVIQLLIHEFAHHYESDHLSDSFHEACCRVGAGIALLAISKPELFT